jgi:hypothetical protein
MRYYPNYLYLINLFVSEKLSNNTGSLIYVQVINACLAT